MSGAPRRRPGSDERRREILDAALALFALGGPEALTVEAIKKRSGASVGSIYHHFGSRTGVAEALIERTSLAYRRALLHRLRRARSTRGLVRALVLHHIDWTQAHPIEARCLHKMGRAALSAADDEVLALVRERLARFAHSGQPCPGLAVPIELLLPLVMGPAREVTRAWLREGVARVGPQVRQTLADAAWRSVAG